MRSPRREALVRRGTQPVPALERQPGGPPDLGTATAERQNPGPVIPPPAWPPAIATPGVGLLFHRTSEYLQHNSASRIADYEPLVADWAARFRCAQIIRWRDGHPVQQRTR